MRFRQLRLIICGMLIMASTGAMAGAAVVPQWGIFELALKGPAVGNPFVDVKLAGKFSSGGQSLSVDGFYDGDGIYRIRFMPTVQGHWEYVTSSNGKGLDGVRGSFDCSAPEAGNHGPVRVAYTYHFAYADGTPFVQIGTTAYGWANEPEDVEERTLESLRGSPFNKVRMMLLPSKNSGVGYPYPRDASGKWDRERFNPQFFQHFEKRIGQLGEQGVEADVILFNPYKKGEMEWFDELDDAADERYIRYVVARLSAYHNVWWSLANEYGQVKHKTDADWDLFFQTVQGGDAYGHLKSIHNAAKFYDANKPWVTHASVQNGSAVADFGRAVLYRELVAKPVVYDEVCYEGHIDRRWGQLSGQEMVKRFWLGTIAGTYVGHGETLTAPEGTSWTGSGGRLMGQSPARLAFLRKVLEAGPKEGIEPMDEYYQTHIGGKAGEYYLVYFGEETPTAWKFSLPRDPPAKNALEEGMKFRVDVLDTWNMTVTPVEGTFTTGKLDVATFRDVNGGSVKLPGKPYIALRIERVK
jgi:Domain of unknown function (DUF5605)/Domain of unknown function (DUF5060)/Protein of unknown function (DUF4038)